MIQLTSDLDFKLTKKRLNMMQRKNSVLRSSVVSSFVLPALILLALIFCTQRSISDDAIYADVELSSEVINENLPYNSASRIFYGPDGEKYTGEQNWYFEKTGTLHRKHIYHEGREVQVDIFDLHGNQLSQFKTIWSTGESGMEVTSHFKLDASNEPTLIWENIAFDSVTVVKKYFPNGQIEHEYAYEATHGEYDGLMTSYDEDGNILALARYDMGEMVEKIK